MDYHEMRKPFEPATVKLVMLAESPPASTDGLYFYNTAGSTHEPLFKATMLALDITCESKTQGLREFQRRGVLLLDVSYTPVDKSYEEEHGAALERGYRELVSMLSKLPSGVPIAVVMVDIYLRFAHRLRADGFNVIKRRIPFPAHNRQNKETFRGELASIVAEYDI